MFVDAAPNGAVHPAYIRAADVVFRKECLEKDVNEFLRLLGFNETASLPKLNVGKHIKRLIQISRCIDMLHESFL